MASWFFVPSLSARYLPVLLCAAAGCLFLPASSAREAKNATAAIKLDQVGYPVDAPKLAIVSQDGDVFLVKRAANDQTVFKGRLSPQQTDSNSGDRVRIADFSAFKRPGDYYLEVPGVGQSWRFSIDRNVYNHAFYLAMRGFYGQRCGIAVDLGPEFPGFKHGICHQHGEYHSTSGKSGEYTNSGGWHDAGDYGRYVVNSGITMGTLLWSWEIYGKQLKSLSLKIPESGNGTPDVLNEIRWNLKWMLGMQDADGGVWHKQTSEHFSGFVAPDADTLPSEVIGTGAAPYKSTCATADLAAVAAIAARVYRPYDAALAIRSLDAARKAWAWTEQNPNVTFRNPPGVTTGEYGDSNCKDERLWAAAELYRTTGEDAFNSFFLKEYAAFLPALDSPPAENWSSVGAMGLWTYALAKRPHADRSAIDQIRARTLAAARAIVTRTEANPYRVSMQAKDYVWGSNSIAASYGMYLLIANRFKPDTAFVNAARDNLHYLLGRNTFSLSWVTQVGEHPFQHPHHRPSAAKPDDAPWPGLLSGGPNAGRQDAALAALPKDLPPAKVYADETASYASNEIAINWQASLVFLLTSQLR